jgi:hypothetical protein
MTDRETAEQTHPHDTIVEGACPTCGGELATRITRTTVWAWCTPCRRLSRPVLFPGPGGPMLMHRAAAA